MLKRPILPGVPKQCSRPFQLTFNISNDGRLDASLQSLETGMGHDSTTNWEMELETSNEDKCDRVS